MKNTLIGIAKLTRYNAVWGFAILQTLLGALITENQVEPVKLLIVVIANSLAVTFAFMINDVEDAEDDAMDPKKQKRNPISAGLISKRTGYLASFVFALVSVIFFLVLNLEAALVGFAIIAIGFLYSWKKVRFKGMPILDMFTHAMFLAGGVVLAAFLSFSDINIKILLPFIAVSLFSMAGDLFNELRDFEVDQKSNLKNTASLLGYQRTLLLKNGLMAASIILIIVFAFQAFHLINTTALLIGLLGVMIVALVNVVFLKKRITDFDNSMLIDPFYVIINIVLAVSVLS